MVASPPSCSYATLDLHILCDMHVPIWKLRGTVLGTSTKDSLMRQRICKHDACTCMLYLSHIYIYIFQILLYDICTHIQNRCAYARVFCITEVSGCSKTLLCGNPGFPMKQHVLLVKVWSMWALEAVWGWRRWRQELVDHLGPWSGIEKLERLRDLGDETMRHSQVEACSFCMVVFWQY